MDNEEKFLKQQVAEMDEFTALCKPLKEWLQNNYDPFTKIIISHDKAEVYKGVMLIPFVETE